VAKLKLVLSTCELGYLPLRDKVKWFHSGMTDDFREKEMHALIIGDSYGEGSTDAAGMVS
jgi:hypothetical protein